MRSRHLLLMALLVAGIALLLLVWVPVLFDAPSEEAPRREAPPDLRVDPEATLIGAAEGAPRVEPTAPPPAQEDEPAMAGCSVFGTVTRGSRPVSATVELWRVSGPRGDVGSASEQLMAGLSAALLDPEATQAVASVAAGTDGHYEIANLPLGEYQLLARDADGAEQSEDVSLSPLGQRQSIDLALPGGTYTLHGRLLHVDGTPWSGSAFVFAYARTAPEALRVPLRLDAEGRFQVAGLVSGPFGVAALRAGTLLVLKQNHITVPHPGEWTWVVDDALTHLTTLVVDAVDETPIAGATWHARSREGSADWIAGGRTDAEGRCQIPVGEAAQHRILWASAPGYVTERIRAPSEGVFVLRLPRAARVEGRVTDVATGQPVSGLRVCLTSADDRGGGTTRTDGEGRYAIDGQPAGRVLLFALGAGWVSAEVEGGVRAAAQAFTAHLVSGQTTQRDLEVRQTPRILGRIRNAEGGPVAGARVSVAVHGRQAPEVSVEMLALAAAGYRDLRWPLRRHLEVATASDPNGLYVLDALIPGLAYVVQAEAPGQVTVESERLVIGASGVARLDLTFPPQRWIDVTVVDARSAEPVPEAWVTGRNEDSSWTTVELTDARGRGRLGPLSAGRVTLDVQAEGFQLHDDVGVEADQTEVTVRLEHGLAVSGTVLHPDGSPQREAHVVIFRFDGSERKVVWHQQTDEAGRFATRSLSPGRHVIEASDAWMDPTYEGRAEVEAGDEDVVLRLEKRR